MSTPAPAPAPSVAVIIAAKDAAATIGRAVASALREPEASQVIVVDDGSTDDTAAAARAADDGTGRLLVERLPVNRGPSAARNHALGLVTAERFAILDSDDAVLPGRFARLLALDADLVADNILFVPERTDLDALRPPPTSGRVRPLGFTAFVEGCVHRRSRSRSQLGFLKPVVRTALLRGSGPRYDERVRMGEDFLLYAELLRRGARFLLTDALGYVAVERSDSLSARHTADDLHALLIAEEELASRLLAGGAAARVMARRIEDTHAKYALRAFLVDRHEDGMIPALAGLVFRPSEWRAVTGGLARDKFVAAKARFARPKVAALPGPRLLLAPESPPVRRQTSRERRAGGIGTRPGAG